MGPKWAKMLRSMSPWMAGLRLATWIVDIFLVLRSTGAAAALLRCSCGALALLA